VYTVEQIAYALTGDNKTVLRGGFVALARAGRHCVAGYPR